MNPELLRPYLDDPVLFAREVLGVEPESYQAEIMMDVAKYQMTSVKSGHGTGKTALAAWIILWFLATRPNPRIPCTAPTEHQLRDILWSEIAKWLYRSPMNGSFVWTNERVFFRSRPETWFAVARVASKGDALQGFHAEHLLFVLEEASGIRDALFEPVQGALTEENAKLLMIGNPTNLSGFFYDSHTKNAAAYCRHTLNAEGSARVSRSFIDRIAALYGVDSDPYRVRVLGVFPKAMPDSFISRELIEKGLTFSIEAEKPSGVSLGVDVARYGDDESVIQPVLCYDGAYYKQVRPVVSQKNDTMQLCGMVLESVTRCNRRYPGLTPDVFVDIGGLGAGVYDRLKELREQRSELRFEVYGINFGGRGGKLREDDPIAFANRTGLLWGRIRALLQAGRLDLQQDSRLLTQLTNRKYKLDSDGRIVLERKEEMKSRGIPSPDRADALSLALIQPKRSPKITGITEVR